MIPPDALAEIGEFPVDEHMDQPRWWSRAIAVLSTLTMRGGEIESDLVEVRKSAAASNAVLPHDCLIDARKIIADDHHALKQLGGAVAQKREPLPCFPTPCTPDRFCTHHDPAQVARRRARREVDS